MHTPKVFAQTDLEKLQQLISEFPLATLMVSHTRPGLSDTVTDKPKPELQAYHLPFALEEQGGWQQLQGHIAKANPLWREVSEGAEVLLVFNGPNGYISPNYYPTKKQHGRAVPTWNYAVVHVRGNIRFVQEPDWIKRVIGDFTHQQEHQQELHQAKPWSMADAPEDYIERLVSAVVGVAIEVTEITGQWKMSQNQPPENIEGIIQGLNRVGDQSSFQLAQWIKPEE